MTSAVARPHAPAARTPLQPRSLIVESACERTRRSVDLAALLADARTLATHRSA